MRQIDETRADGSPLVKLASVSFPDLTRAERAMLWFADLDNIDRGEIAVAGPSSNAADPSNDRARADNWEAQRNQVRPSTLGRPSGRRSWCSWDGRSFQLASAQE